MNTPDPSIRVHVDAANPGQFFACCGLLELADRLWPGAEGWFNDDGSEFQIASEGSLTHLLAILVMDPPTEVTILELSALEIKPIIASLKFSFDGGASTSITLDAWNRVASIKGATTVIANPPWNFWSGQQTAHSIWCGLREELAGQFRRFTSADYKHLFTQRLFQKGRFGFDPGPAWNAIDVGFSPNEQNMDVESSPAVEMLAAVGIQRFRPVLHRDRQSFDYWTWHIPFSPAIAAAAMAGAIPDFRSVQFRGCVVSRGQYGALGNSYPISQGVSDE